MIKKAILIGVSLFFAFTVLIISTLRTANQDYNFSSAPTSALSASEATTSASHVLYYLPHHGLLSTHPLWPIKAVRDKVWLLVTFDNTKKTKLLLLFADKRIGMSEELFKLNRADKAVPAAAKAEQYLEAAYNSQLAVAASGKDSQELLNHLALAALKHQEILAGVLSIAPEDARPYITEIENIPISVYEKAKTKLIESNRPIPVLKNIEQ